MSSLHKQLILRCQKLFIDDDFDRYTRPSEASEGTKYCLFTNLFTPRVFDLPFLSLTIFHPSLPLSRPWRGSRGFRYSPNVTLS